MAPFSRQPRVGTSGWSYPHWRTRFYPTDLPRAHWLEYYASRFDTVEINASFYRLPSRDVLTSWSESVQKTFRFSVKASRYITHMKKLLDPKPSTTTFLRQMSVLGDRLGPILFQLPPRWRADPERLERFLAALSRDFRYAFEFRDRSWINDEITDLLARHDAAFCIYDLDGYQSPRSVTTDFVYVRLHGPDGAYCGRYSPQRLSAWARAFADWRTEGRLVYCYFDNDERAYAAENAAALRRLCA